MPGLVAGQPFKKIVSEHEMYDNRSGRIRHVLMLECKHMKRLPPSEAKRVNGAVQCMVCPPVEKKPKPEIVKPSTSNRQAIVKPTITVVPAKPAAKHDERLLNLIETLITQNAQLARRLDQLENIATTPVAPASNA